MTTKASGPVRELALDERMTWGECPVCHAEHGQPCDSLVGIALGVNVHGERPRDGVHLSRLKGAPAYVQEVPARVFEVGTATGQIGNPFPKR